MQARGGECGAGLRVNQPCWMIGIGSQSCHMQACCKHEHWWSSPHAVAPQMREADATLHPLPLPCPPLTPTCVWSVASCRLHKQAEPLQSLSCRHALLPLRRLLLPGSHGGGPTTAATFTAGAGVTAAGAAAALVQKNAVQQRLLQLGVQPLLLQQGGDGLLAKRVLQRIVCVYLAIGCPLLWAELAGPVCIEGRLRAAASLA